jgi:hypothetical protein
MKSPARGADLPRFELVATLTYQPTGQAAHSDDQQLDAEA